MGATTFHDVHAAADVADAFHALKEQAYYDHGHSGYTGTIAEKDGYVVYELPAGRSIDDVLAECGKWGDEKPADWLPAGLYEVYDDKWGPAVAMRDGDGAWHFFGWASE